MQEGYQNRAILDLSKAIFHSISSFYFRQRGPYTCRRGLQKPDDTNSRHEEDRKCTERTIKTQKTQNTVKQPRQKMNVLPATRTRTIIAFTLQSHSITVLWLVLIAPAHGGMARLS